jgi:hypothetical protein
MCSFSFVEDAGHPKTGATQGERLALSAYARLLPTSTIHKLLYAPIPFAAHNRSGIS